MIDLFFIKVFLSFIVGSIWITGVSILAEKFGPKIGGAIAAIPATMVVAILFIGLTQSLEAAVQSTTAVPIMLGVNIIFTLVYLIFSRKNFYVGLFSALTVWFALAAYIKIIRSENLINSIFFYVISLICGYYCIEKVLKVPSITMKKIIYTPRLITIRSAIAGGIIVSAVIAARYSGPFLGGIIASFPALSIAMMIIIYHEHGVPYTASFFKNFTLVGTINVFTFIFSIRYTYPLLGLAMGTTISFLVSLLSSYLTYQLINKRLS